MSDFAYDNKDFTAIRVATKNLESTQTHAAILSTIIGALVVGNKYRLRSQPNSLWNRKGPFVLTSAGIIISCIK